MKKLILLSALILTLVSCSTPVNEEKVIVEIDTVALVSAPAMVVSVVDTTKVSIGATGTTGAVKK